MALSAAGFRGLDQQGVRRMEKRSPKVAAALNACIAANDRASFLRVWQAQTDLYAELRQAMRGQSWQVRPVEVAVRDYLAAAMK
ncbi:MAG: hypothetical protein HY291_15990 [Planctomycetes bacterium]|nr:hypothetical protein [Planctomycetota bacterium]